MPLLGASGLDCRCSGGLRVYDGRVLVVETGSVAAPAMWASTVVFASVHLLSASALTWGLLPYVLLYVLGLFFSGCVFVYLRVNLGFGWALGAHMLCNLPPALFLLGALCD